MTPTGAQSDVEDAERRVVLAAQRLLDNDAHLLAVDANERSITHKLAEHLQPEFPDWHVDCEYNRDGDKSKRLHLPGENAGSEDSDGSTVFPDIIIHRRGTTENLVVIEAKKKSNPTGPEADMVKLAAFKKELGYSLSVSILFSTGSRIGATLRFSSDTTREVQLAPE